jgi:hypothetical protein
MMIPRVLFFNVTLEANIPPNIKEDVASKPNRNAYNIVVKRASGATSPKRFFWTVSVQKGLLWESREVEII